MKKKKQKPDISWIETHHEIVSAITLSLVAEEKNRFLEVYENQGTGGIWELAEQLTDEFESLHKDRQWDGEFYDEIQAFLLYRS